MKVYEGREFRSFHDDGGSLFEDIEFRRCSFISSAISITRKPSQRSTVRRCRVISCEQRGCAIDTAVLEDVLMEGLLTHGLLQTWGAVFKHVTLRGRLGRIMTSDRIATGTATPAEQRAFDEANAAYYAAVDWALDLREAEFTDEPDFRGVPARLVIRDPDSQVVVTRERAMQGTWRQVDLSKTYWEAYIQGMLKDGYPDVLLVAPKRSRRFRNLRDGLEKLRDAGATQPD
jgi:hypothetical protein